MLPLNDNNLLMYLIYIVHCTLYIVHFYDTKVRAHLSCVMTLVM